MKISALNITLYTVQHDFSSYVIFVKLTIAGCKAGLTSSRIERVLIQYCIVLIKVCACMCWQCLVYHIW